MWPHLRNRLAPAADTKCSQRDYAQRHESSRAPGPPQSGRVSFLRRLVYQVASFCSVFWRGELVRTCWLTLVCQGIHDRAHLDADKVSAPCSCRLTVEAQACGWRTDCQDNISTNHSPGWKCPNTLEDALGVISLVNLNNRNYYNAT